MGYCYTASGALCCDLCGAAGGVRKRACPSGYCQPAAVCPACWRTRRAELDAAHVAMDCAGRHAAFVAREQADRDAQARGEWVRKAAVNADGRVGIDGPVVRVWFRCGTAERQVDMPAALYRARPLLEVVTLADFARDAAAAGVALIEADPS